MAYKKPQVVAKSAAKQSFVAGCGANTPFAYCAPNNNMKCMAGQLK